MNIIPINVDRNVSPAYFQPLADKGELLVTSVFYTIQGEGPFAGQPAVFIRLAGCNIGRKDDCAFCDTYFAVDTGMRVTPDGLLDEVANLWPGGYGSGRPPLVVITGGEPMLQWPMLQQFIYELHRQAEGVRVQIETNGMYLRPAHLAWEEDHFPVFGALKFVISPKISRASGRYITPRDGVMSGPRVPYLKFVVTADPCSVYHKLPLEWLAANGVDADLVYVSGMTDYTGTNAATPDSGVNLLTGFAREARERTALNWSYAASLALRHGFNLSLQTHLLAGVK